MIKEIVQEVLQEERLTLYNTLLSYRNNTENQEWNQFSLEQAMRGLENDHLPEYTEADIIENGNSWSNCFIQISPSLTILYIYSPIFHF
ncbi:hypothetical protein PN480_18525 [Dolichospermum circinale CS-1225]|uniref:hypothetical protein n=1 Tax=Dolichospermum circinale TaxID=109265 RepID=UPI0003F69780|nr:hypothetical protein [Dolichospermum circinale]MDB9459576.1 hypothetical protein [Dolichospermum circinale CS-545/17]MDB9468083.1 hypothetical protein [Dolichospermum circinale CS-539/09]MDB9471330.1 hypothetical protein [Dolichospermum circinale CS-539]MDB9523924.1 hypothetical protein [Dolichospermum circinale CS-1225]